MVFVEAFGELEMVLSIALQLSMIESIRTVKLEESELFYHRSGASAAATPRRLSPQGRRKIVAFTGTTGRNTQFQTSREQEVLGIDSDGEVLVAQFSPIAVAKTGRLRYSQNQADWFGDVEIMRSPVGFTVRGPEPGFIDGKTVSVLKPAPDQNYFVGVHSATPQTLHIFSGQGLAQHREIALRGGNRNVSIDPLDLSLLVLRNGHALAFSGARNFANAVREKLPWIGTTSGKSSRSEKFLIRIDLESGECTPIARLSAGSSQSSGLSGFVSRHLAPLGDRGVLLAQGDWIYTITLSYQKPKKVS